MKMILVTADIDGLDHTQFIDYECDFTQQDRYKDKVEEFTQGVTNIIQKIDDVNQMNFELAYELESVYTELQQVKAKNARHAM